MDFLLVTVTCHDHKYALSCPIVDPFLLKSTPAKIQSTKQIPELQITPIKSAITLSYGDFTEAESSATKLLLSTEHNFIQLPICDFTQTIHV